MQEAPGSSPGATILGSRAIPDLDPDSLFTQVLRAEYIDNAFRAARRADPDILPAVHAGKAWVEGSGGLVWWSARSRSDEINIAT
jgi:hypothetical protein